MDKALKEELVQIIPQERIRNRFIDLVSFAADAGFYYLLPKAVVQPVNENEITRLFDFSKRHKMPLVFRTGGTSLSGQSITDGILVDLSQFWNRISKKLIKKSLDRDDAEAKTAAEEILHGG